MIALPVSELQFPGESKHKTQPMKFLNSPTCEQPAATLRRVVIVAVLSACLSSSLSRAADSTIAWGNNNNSQTVVPGNVTNVVAVAAGTLHSLALRANGTVAGWGDNLFGQTNVSSLSQVRAVAGGSTYSLALLSNGTVVVRGTQPAPPPGLANVIAIAAGWRHCLALKQDGTVVSWGDSNSVPAGLSNVVAIAAGDGNSLALLTDRTVVAWGDTNFNKTVVPAGLANVVAIAAGKDHCVVLQWNGNVVAWGRNADGQATVPPGLSNVAAVTAGAFHTVALSANGSIVAWGNNTFAQSDVPGWTRFYQIAAGGYHNLGQLGDGQPYVTLQPRSQMIPVSQGVTFTTLAVGAQPMLYQWHKNGEVLPGRTNRSLTLNNITLNDAGDYSVSVVNSNGAASSSIATLTAFYGPPAIEAPPEITSPLSVFGIQGEPLFYQIIATNYPNQFAVDYLPLALTLDTNTGVISGTPIEPGTFTSTIFAINDYGSTNKTLTLTISSGAPSITGPLTVVGNENQNLTYQIRLARSSSGVTFFAENLPVGLSVDSVTGEISGEPIYAGTSAATIVASNSWGTDSATLQFNIAYAQISGLTLGDLTYNYHSPFLLDFEFTLRDANGQGIVVSPNLLRALCMENTHPGTTQVLWPDDQPDLPTATNMVTNVISETGVFITRSGGNTGGKVTKAYLVLDFSASVSDPAINGDSNNDGVSDAVEYMVNGAQYFVSQQQAGTQVGVYEFHRDDADPNQVIALSRDKQLLSEAIAGIWTNYVNFFYAGSRCWDAVDAAILAFGNPNPDEQRSVIFISDGQDTSSSATVNQLISDAIAGGVRVYCIAYGNNPDTNTLGRITSQTGGRLFEALSQVELFEEFANIAKDVQARYILRWASLRRDATEIAPFFLISYQGFTNAPPVWTWGNSNDYVTNSIEMYMTNIDMVIDTNSQPPVTNITETIETNTLEEISAYWTNADLGPYIATNYTGTVTEGSLRLVLDEEVEPTGISLRVTYIPRFIRQLRLRYRPNWPCTVFLNATNTGEMLRNWSLTETNHPDGSRTLLLSSPNPQNTTTSLPFPGFGPLLTFRFKDILTNSAQAFAFIEVDNSIYTNIIAGGQRFVFETGNTNSFVTSYPALPFGTPVPWLLANGFTNNFPAAEIADQDGDGVPTWKEYLGNTDPQDPASRFAVRGLSNDIYGRYQITFSTATTRRYRVESSFDLIDWETVEDNIPGTGNNVTILDHRYQPWITEVFYRAVTY